MLQKLQDKLPLFIKKTFDHGLKYNHRLYQDIMINGKLVKKAGSDYQAASPRYKIIQRVLNLYKRPFTMLDIGALHGYYSFKTAHDYGCVCVMIEGDSPEYPKISKQLINLCKSNSTLDNIILLNRHPVYEDLKRLSESEAFDVVLALDILRYGGPWKDVADAVLSMGDRVIVEIPLKKNTTSKDGKAVKRALEEYLISRGADILCDFPQSDSESQSKMYMVTNEKKNLKRKQWLIPRAELKHLTIVSDYEKKQIVKVRSDPSQPLVSDWQPGINLMTFLMYHGAYPSRRMIKKAMKNIVDRNHNDWTVNNMILQGNKITLIDWDDPKFTTTGGRRSTRRVLRKHLQLLSIKDPKKAEFFFWKRLIKIKSDN